MATEDGPELVPPAEEVQPGPSQESLKKPTGWNSFFKSVAPDVMTELGEDAQLGHVSTVVAKMWKKLPADRRKEKAQRTREDIDMGLVENKRCGRCNTSFTRDKDLKYHLKGYMCFNLCFNLCFNHNCGELIIIDNA
ncbi:hypothetical protein Bbelb_053580 [Branchiostoma belcheri]|nr:hypothetical protein Bbelb_053580 [Branchiostoma belcheri]